jgi:DNA-binding NtrC family response regulator
VTTRILVVDDEKNILALFRKMLSFEAFRTIDHSAAPVYGPVDVETASSGEDAWDLVQAGFFDLIISDLAMGGMSGIDLLERVKSLKPDIPFMILTGVGTIEDAVRSMKLGAYDYLTKPFQHDELLLSITKALDYGRLHSEVKALREKLIHHEANPDVVESNRAGSDRKTIPENKKKGRHSSRSNDNEFALSDAQVQWVDDFIRNKVTLKSISDRVSGEVEKIVIQKILAEVGDNKAEVARRLGISRPALYKKMKDHHIE